MNIPRKRAGRDLGFFITTVNIQNVSWAGEVWLNNKRAGKMLQDTVRQKEWKKKQRPMGWG